MPDSSDVPRRVALARLGMRIGVWALFVLTAHEVVHRYLFEVGPVPGSGVLMLAVQSGFVAMATLTLLLALRPSHFLNLRAIVATVIWVVLIVLGHYLSHLAPGEVRETLAALREAMGMGALVAGAATLAILLGLPFVPSVEMGLLMMAVFGRDGAVAAWLATVAGLSMAYAAGRYMPADWMLRWLERHQLLSKDADPAQPFIAELRRRLQNSNRRWQRAAALLLRHRYLLVAALINLPGNSVLGGGGGIALLCGFARLYRWPWFLLTVALASLPIPLLVFLGLAPVDDWLAALGER